MAYPTSLDTWTAKVDGAAGDEIVAAHINSLQTAVAAIQTKLGIDNSGVVGTIDHLVKNAAAIDPGHHHTSASIDSVSPSVLAWSGLTPGHVLFASAADAAAFRKIQEADIEPGSIYAKLNAAQTATGKWTFNAGADITTLGFKSIGGSGLITFTLPSTSLVQPYLFPTTADEGVLTHNGLGGLTWGPAGGNIITDLGATRNNDYGESIFTQVDAVTELDSSDPAHVDFTFSAPVGSNLERVLVWNATEIVIVNGTGGYDVGIDGNPTAFGSAISQSQFADNVANSHYTGDKPIPAASQSIRIRPAGGVGQFSGTSGVIVMTAFYVRFTAATSAS